MLQDQVVSESAMAFHIMPDAVIELCHQYSVPTEVFEFASVVNSISDDGRSILRTWSSWKMGIGLGAIRIPVFSDIVCRWTFHIDQKRRGIMIGIACDGHGEYHRGLDGRNTICDGKSSYLHDGMIEMFRTGDNVSMELHCPNDTLRYFVNEQDINVKLSDLSRSGIHRQYRLMVEIQAEDDGLTLTDFEW